jgi:hypothetical protein
MSSVTTFRSTVDLFAVTVLSCEEQAVLALQSGSLKLRAIRYA